MSEKKPTDKTFETRTPDIAFWFDQEDSIHYIVKTRKDISHIEVLQAAFDLLTKAIMLDEGSTVEREMENIDK